ncbi:unnamed protein product [Parnassius apollo]|uniref:(apollo) hypothetical protein n=1 Tax=Parnassius apollo TaxID=110799 RepID=A0A8S3YH04_PARAO|nr:unnamed protein product [Parnassius apollo]
MPKEVIIPKEAIGTDTLNATTPSPMGSEEKVPLKEIPKQQTPSHVEIPDKELSGETKKRMSKEYTSAKEAIVTDTVKEKTPTQMEIEVKGPLKEMSKRQTPYPNEAMDFELSAKKKKKFKWKL